MTHIKGSPHEETSACAEKWKPCDAAFNSSMTRWRTVIINPCSSLHRGSVVWPGPRVIEETLAEEWVMEALMLVTVHFTSSSHLHLFIHSFMTVHDDTVQILRHVLCCCVGTQRNQGPCGRQGRHGHQRRPCEWTYCWSQFTWWDHVYTVLLSECLSEIIWNEWAHFSSLSEVGC